MMKYIIGIDEAGRGPLAGPIVAAAVLSIGTKKQKSILSGVRDSKKMMASDRDYFFDLLINNFVYAITELDNNFIDRYGIQAANILLVRELLDKLKNQQTPRVEIKADYIGGAEQYFRKENVSFYKHGDDIFKEISAASIIAKVYRDRLMEDYDKEYPHYGFFQHKGYGTKLHLTNIKKYGHCPLHRITYLKNLSLFAKATGDSRGQ